MNVGTGLRASKTPERTLNGHTHIGADPGDTEQRFETRQGAGREPRDQHGVLAMRMRRHVPKKGKREHREAKRRSAEKIEKQEHAGEIKEIKQEMEKRQRPTEEIY